MTTERTVYTAIAELEQQNRAGAFCTIVRSKGSTPRGAGSKMLVYEDGSILGTVGGGELENRVIAGALEAMMDGVPRVLEYSMADPQRGDPGVCGGQVEVYVEPVLPKPTLLIIGAGHVGKALAHLAHWLDFFVVVSDDRQEYCNPEFIPEADKYLAGPMEELVDEIDLTRWTYVVLTTRGVDVDIQVLPDLLDSQAGYLGVIGSKRRWATTRNKLLENGLPEEKVDRVRSPIGLELNAETPEEIAVSIMAEIIMLRRGGDGGVMSEK